MRSFTVFELRCNECARKLTDETMKSLNDGTLLCPRCFQQVIDDEGGDE